MVEYYINYLCQLKDIWPTSYNIAQYTIKNYIDILSWHSCIQTYAFIYIHTYMNTYIHIPK